MRNIVVSYDFQVSYFQCSIIDGEDIFTALLNGLAAIAQFVYSADYTRLTAVSASRHCLISILYILRNKNLLIQCDSRSLDMFNWAPSSPPEQTLLTLGSFSAMQLLNTSSPCLRFECFGGMTFLIQNHGARTSL